MGHEATDTWLPNAPVSQATGHCHGVQGVGGGEPTREPDEG